MNEEGSLFDVPPAAIGRYLVRQPLGTGTTGPVFQAQDPSSRALVTIKLLKVDLSPDEAHTVAQALTRLAGAMPRHDALVRPLDAGLDEIEAFFVTEFVEGESLEAALRDFGPAAIEDLVPRLRSLAGALDAAHRAGFVHGALHPRDILVSPDTTHITGIGIAPVLAKAAVALPLRPPYSAPEVATGAPASAAADQFSLAAIAFEWLFGRRITGPADGLVDVRELPGVDRDALSNAFTIALAPDAETRFDSCRAFAEAVAGAVEPDQVAMLVDEAVIAPPLLHNDDPVGPFVSEPAHVDAIAPVAWNPGMAPEKTPERFGGGALIAATVIGLIVGFVRFERARCCFARETRRTCRTCGTCGTCRTCRTCRTCASARATVNSFEPKRRDCRGRRRHPRRHAAGTARHRSWLAHSRHRPPRLCL